MTHHLVVYVLQLTGSRPQNGRVDAAVLARHESPGFSLISYRRSGINARDAGCDLPALEATNGSNFTALLGDTHEISATSDDMEIDSSAWQKASPYETKRPQHALPTGYQQQQQQHKEAKYGKSHELHLDSYQWTGRSDDSVEDDSSWQRGPTARACGFREKGQQLIILWRFLRSVSLRDLGFGPCTAAEHVRPHWLRAASVLRAAASAESGNIEDVTSSILSGLFCSAFVVQQDRNSYSIRGSTESCRKPAATVFSDGQRAVLRMTAHLFLRVISLRSVQQLARSACSATNQTQVQEVFVLLVSHVYDTFGDVLREISRETRPAAFGNQGTSVVQLVDEVLSIAYAQPHFAETKADLSALLLDQQTLSDALNGYISGFSAEITPSIYRRKPTRQQLFELRPGGNDTLWSQRWLLDPGSLQMVDISSGKNRNVEDLYLLNVTQFVYEFGCIDVTIETHAACMLIRSALLILGGSLTAPTTLVLDGKLRALNVFPSGFPSVFTTIGGWIASEYSAVLSDDGRSVSMHLLGFAEAQMNTGGSLRGLRSSGNVSLRRISLTMKLEEEFNGDEDSRPSDPRDLFAFVHGMVYGSTFYSANEQTERLALSYSSLDRAEIWKEAKWTLLSEFQAGYIALPGLGFIW
ncbi:hypothetical protein V7S43_002355 [Phytophthora oleae]